MSAVTPFLERQNDPAFGEAEEEEFQIPAAVSAAEQGTLADDKGASIPSALQFHGVPALGDTEPSGQSMLYMLGLEVLDKTHAELLNTAYIRQAVEQSLIGRSYHVQARDIKGARPNEVFIILDGPIVEGFEDGETVAAWSPPATPNAQQFKVLSWTSKMGAPSFSLPAGPAEAGGSCPGAAAGQSIVPAKKLLQASNLVRNITGKPVRLQQAICQYCYAEGGQYSTGQVQFAQVLRYLWTVQSSKTPEGRAAWVEAMSYAVEHANYRLEGGKVGKTEYLPERFEGRYFRIHDSGDFFSKKYLMMWKEVANRHPDILFWAPTRCWATPWGIKAVNEINAGESNLVIRPSAYHINEPAPLPEQLGPGWAKGSTCYHISLVPQGAAEGAYDFDCQAYAVDSEHVTCRNATGPDGNPGCRACWRFGDEMAINYTLH